MDERNDHGVPVILGTLIRTADWTEPYAEGDHCLNNECHVGDD